MGSNRPGTVMPRSEDSLRGKACGAFEAHHYQAARFVLRSVLPPLLSIPVLEARHYLGVCFQARSAPVNFQHIMTMGGLET